MNSLFRDRRNFLSRAGQLTAAGLVLPFAGMRGAHALGAASKLHTAAGLGTAASESRSLAFNHTHTREQISLVYAADGHYVPDALMMLNRFLRDHYSGAVGRIDPQLFDLLHRVRLVLGASSLNPYDVISGYRCRETNDHLRNSRGGGVAKRSLHMDGKAIDLRIPGVPLAELRDAAISLKAGGVGYYPNEQFVHIDTGRVRTWG